MCSNLVSSDIDYSSSDNPTKKGHLMMLTNANENIWERRWFVLKRWVLSPISYLL